MNQVFSVHDWQRLACVVLASETRWFLKSHAVPVSVSGFWILKCQGGLTLGNLNLKARIQKPFLLIHIFTIPGIFHSLCRSKSPGIVCFFSLERPSLTISYSASLMLTNSTTSCCLKSIFISPSYFKDTFTGYRLLVASCYFILFLIQPTKNVIPLPYGLHCF